MKPSLNVLSSYQNHQEENISSMKYKIYDTNGKDLMRYDKKYVLVIDVRPFTLNNYEENLKDLMSFNYIMKSEEEDFNYIDIMKNKGKIYYDISEDTFNKISKLKNIKGIYTYIYDEADIKKAWSIGSIFSDILDEKWPDGSLFDGLSNYLKNNQNIREYFYLDDKSEYSIKNMETSEQNNNIALTIDMDMEDKIAEVLSDDKYSYLKNASVAIMESDTGKIRAMIQKDESEPDLNMCIDSIGYEPGSVYKIITLATAIDRGLININDKFVCRGAICRTCHGTLTVREAFKKSCNDIFADIGKKIGYDNLMKTSKSLGLYNKVLNVSGDSKNESEGLEPKEEYGLSNISIGQCMNVTPLQILGAINTINNEGIYVKPYLVEKILDSNDKCIKTFETDQKRIFTETTSKIVKDFMKDVVINGTGKKANVNGVDIGGKTGSATSSEGYTHGWFGGYFNINNKKYSMIVFTPNLNSKEGDNTDLGGGDTAAPIFKDIVEKLNK